MKLYFTLSRYFMKNFFVWFAIFMFAILCLVILFDFSEQMRKSASKEDVGVAQIAELVFLRLPYMAQQLTPFIVLFASIFVFWKLNRSNEIIVARASGISIWQIIFPVVAGALIIGFIDIVVVNPVSAIMMEKYKRVNSGLFHGAKGGFTLSETGIWIRHLNINGPEVLKIDRVNEKDSSLEKIMILEYDNNNNYLGRIDAKNGKFVNNGIQLNDVIFMRLDKPVENVTTTIYPTTLTQKDFFDTNMPPEALSFWEIPSYVKLLEKSGLSSSKYQLYWQSLVAKIVWLAAMVVLAATCSLRYTRRSGTSIIIGIGVSLGFLLYFLSVITYTMGQSGTLPTVFAAWAPVIVSSFLGITALLHLEDG